MPFLRILICLVFLLTLPLPLAAQDNLIKVIEDDGSVTEFELPEEAVNAPVPTIVRPAKRTPMSPRPQGKNDTSRKQTIAVEREEEGRQSAPAVKEPAPAKKDEGEQAVKQGSERKTVEEKAPVAKKEARFSYPPRPGRKPLLPQKVKKAAKSLPPDMAIPQNLAVSIAIRHAPPAKDFRVVRRMHDDIPVYAVVFKTEGEPYVVLVDARSGKVVSDQPINDF